MAKSKAQERAEMDALVKLQAKHGYLLHRMPHASQRYTNVITFKTGEMHSMYVVKFAVPIDSQLAKAMIAADKVKDRKPRAKTKRRAA